MCKTELDKMKLENKRLQEAIAILVEGLEFYAEGHHYTTNSSEDIITHEAVDFGSTAKEFLSDAEELTTK